MPNNTNITGYLSATATLSDLFNWFPKDDILKLQKFGYRIEEYESENYKYIDNHYVICETTSKLLTKYKIDF